jgi:hypothetical protein
MVACRHVEAYNQVHRERCVFGFIVFRSKIAIGREQKLENFIRGLVLIAVKGPKPRLTKKAKTARR